MVLLFERWTTKAIVFVVFVVVSLLVGETTSVPIEEERRAAGKTSFVSLKNTLTLAKRFSSHSWEYGATIQASLEVHDPTLSVFSTKSFPNGKIPVVRNGGENVKALQYAKQHIVRNGGNALADGEGSIGDPASLGVAALLLGTRYRAAVERQMNTVQAAPRFYNGAISHRQDVAELWADSVFMTPPFLAYYAVATNNQSMLRQAVQQCELHREVLQANTTESWRGLWTHIVGPQSQSLGIWATGNGWAALGMVRVLATVQNWSVSKRWTLEQVQLTQWLMEIFDGLQAVETDSSTGFVRNYLVGGVNSQSDTEGVTWFGDGTATAAFVAAALRLAVLQPLRAKQLIKWTKPFREALQRATNAQGLLRPTVDPLDWYTTAPITNGSPEGQAFLTMAGAAWRDCVAAKVCSAQD